METNNIFDGVLDRMIEDEAWQNLSSSYPFSAELLEKYKDRLTEGNSQSHRRKAFLPPRFS